MDSLPRSYQVPSLVQHALYGHRKCQSWLVFPVIPNCGGKVFIHNRNDRSFGQNTPGMVDLAEILAANVETDEFRMYR